MAKYVLTDWEINGFEDSDFMLTYWDSKHKIMGSHMHGSTRFGGCQCKPTPIEGGSSYHLCGENPEVLLMPTAAVVEEARQWLEHLIFVSLTVADKRVVDEPNVRDLQPGLEVRLLSDCKMQVNETEPCSKCNGTGVWTNPKRLTDVRTCFACNGSKVRFLGKKKDSNGKLVYEKLTAGMHGTVVDWKSFGRFFANGYNQPNRSNTTVQFCVDGRIVRANLEKLRLHREYASPDMLRDMALRQSFNYQFSAASGHKFAWDTYNFAAQVSGKPNV